MVFTTKKTIRRQLYEEDFVPDNLALTAAKRAMQKQVMAISDGPGTLEQKNKRINQIKKAFSEKYPNINN